MINLFQKQSTPKESRSAAMKVTTAADNKSEARRQKSYFESKWGITDGYVKLKDFVMRIFCAYEIEQIIEDIKAGYTLEPYYDSKNHKRYWKRPTKLIKGFIVDGVRYSIALNNNEAGRKTLSIYQELTHGHSIKLSDINIHDYVNFNGFLPVLDSRGLSFDIWRVLNHAVRSNK